MRFKVIAQNLYNDEIGFYEAFGIEVSEKDSGEVVDFISDLFSDYEKAKDFAELLQECQPELVHFRELCLNEIE